VHETFTNRPYPATLSAVLDEIGKLTVWSGQHREELAALAAEATGIHVKSWSAAFALPEFSLGPVTDAHVAQQQQLAHTIQALGICRASSMYATLSGAHRPDRDAGCAARQRSLRHHAWLHVCTDARTSAS